MDVVARVTPPLTVGERIVVRYLLAEGSATDLIGWVNSIDDRSVLVRDKDGRLIQVPRSKIVATRRVPAVSRGRDPMREDAARLEQLAAEGWAADTEPLGDWLLRSAGGLTGRANSCLAAGDPGMSIAEAATKIISYADRHQIAPMAQVVEGSAEEAALRSLGWRDTYVVTDVLVMRLSTLLAGRAVDPTVMITDQLTPDWFAAYQQSRPVEEDRDPARQILVGRGPTAFAAVSAADQIVAIGRAHCAQDWLGLASLWTHPGSRGNGLASIIISSLGHWGARNGARSVYLQVARSNEAAHRAYAKAGFEWHHSYRYLAPYSH